MAVLGNIYRLEVDTSSNETPAWKKIGSEVSVSFDQTSDKTEVANKDVGKHKKYIKLRLDSTLSITAHENPSDSTNLGYGDINLLQALNNSDSGGGEKTWRLTTPTVGEDVITFSGFVENLGLPAEDQGLIVYTFGIQVTSLRTLTAVV